MNESYSPDVFGIKCINEGADVNGLNHYSPTFSSPLSDMVAEECLRSVNFLIKHGANVNNNLFMAIRIAANKRFGKMKSLLINSTEEEFFSRMDKIIEALILGGVDPNLTLVLTTCELSLTPNYHSKNYHGVHLYRSGSIDYCRSGISDRAKQFFSSWQNTGHRYCSPST